MKTRLLALFSVLALVALGPVHAADKDVVPINGAFDSSYSPDHQAVAFRAGLNANDTFTTSAVLGTPAFHVGNRTTLSLGARFSASAQTCQVQIAYVYRAPQATSDTDTTTYTLGDSSTVKGNQIKGWSGVVTLTGSATQKEAAYYEAPDYFFDTNRSVTLRIVLVTKPVSGTVDFWAGS